MSQTQKIKTRKFELRGVMQNFSRKEKGSKSCNQPHTAFTILTRLMTPEELDALLFGGCYGAKVCLNIEVVIEKPDDTDISPRREARV